jgi:hypothetical protein
MWIVGVTKVVERGDRLNDAFNGFRAKGGNSRCYDGKAADEMLTQFIVERANAPCLRVHDKLQIEGGGKVGPAGRGTKGLGPRALPELRDSCESYFAFGQRSARLSRARTIFDR